MTAASITIKDGQRLSRHVGCVWCARVLLCSAAPCVLLGCCRLGWRIAQPAAARQPSGRGVVGQQPGVRQQRHGWQTSHDNLGCMLLCTASPAESEAGVELGHTVCTVRLVD